MLIKSSKMFKYKLRLDTIDEGKIKVFIERYIKGDWIYSFEDRDGSNPHSHLYIETDIKRETMVSWIRKNIGAGNRSYSLKKLEDEHNIYKYIAYVIKEGDYHQRVQSGLLEKAKEYDLKVKKEMSDKKKTVVERIKVDIGDTFDGSLYDLVDKVTDMYIAEGKLVRQFQLVSIIQTLALHYNVDDFRKTYKMRLIEKIIL